MTTIRLHRRAFLAGFSHLVAILLCVAVPFTSFAADGYKVAHDGGSIPEVKTGSELRLFIEQDRIRLMTKKAEVISIPTSAITEISYVRTYTAGSVPRLGSL
jgi:hypothetical protein